MTKNKVYSYKFKKKTKYHDLDRYTDRKNMQDKHKLFLYTQNLKEDLTIERQ